MVKGRLAAVSLAGVLAGFLAVGAQVGAGVGLVPALVAGLALGGALAALALAYALHVAARADRALVEQTRSHMATLARVVRETGERAAQASDAMLRLADRQPPPADALAVVPAEPPRDAAGLAEVHADVASLGRIVGELADSLQGQDERLREIAGRLDALSGAGTGQPRKSVALANALIGLRLGESPAPADEAADAAAAARREAETLRDTLQKGEVEGLLRPISALPDGKPRLYAATIGASRLGAAFMPSALSATAVRLELGRQRDAAMLQMLLKVARFFHQRRRDTPIVAALCDVGILSDGAFGTFIEELRGDSGLARMVLVGIPQSALLALRPVQLEVIRAYREAGGRLVATGVTDLSARPETLAGIGVRYARVPATAIMAAREGGHGFGDIHLDDLCDYYARRGIELIAGDVADEAERGEMERLRFPLADGDAMGDWRAVRGDLLVAPPAAPQQDNSAAAPEAPVVVTPVPTRQSAFRSMLRRA